MPTRRFSIGGLVCLAAALSIVADELGGELRAGNLCREESASCLALDDLSGIPSPDNDELPRAGSTGRWAERRSNKRRRRVGFSHEDVAGDESLQPFLQAFKDSLSGTRKDVASQVEQEDSVPATNPRVSSVAGEANEVTEKMVGRTEFGHSIRGPKCATRYSHVDIVHIRKTPHLFHESASGFPQKKKRFVGEGAMVQPA